MPPNPLAHPFAPPLAATATQTIPSNPNLPTLSAFLLSHLPTLSPLSSAAEVPWLYHSSTPPRRNHQTPKPLPAKPCVERLVFSITPTEGVYNALGAAPQPPAPLDLNSPATTTASATTIPPPTNSTLPIESTPHAAARKPFTAAFIHRPWTLSRARLPRGTTVWSSHKGFDEALTTGCNFALLQKLGLDAERATVLTGYKGDEGRRIGAVAGVRGVLEEEGGWFGFADGEVKAVACMNAFHPNEVERVASVAVASGFADDVGRCEGLVYLTGAVREEGLKAALEKGMRVVCVGHRLCEVWGVRYLAERVREMWPALEVRVVDEEEGKVEKPKKAGKKNGSKEKVEVRSRNEQAGGKEVMEDTVTSKRRKISVDESEDGGMAL
ncbi:hypothetical protein Q7P37_006399 [Cladosporium fusiforme]